MSRASLPASLLTAITAAVPANEVPKLIAAWAIVLHENAARTERIRAQIKARGADGFIRHAAARDFTDNSLDARPDGAQR